VTEKEVHDGYFHLAPKFKGGKSWGGPFELAPDPDGALTKGELEGVCREGDENPAGGGTGQVRDDLGNEG
jgi:hypothetical protein